MDSLERVRLSMEAAEGTECDLSKLRELAKRHPERAEYSSEELALLEDDSKKWAVLMASGLVSMDGLLDQRGREHVHSVAEAAYEEIDSRRPGEYWISKENEAQDEAITWNVDRNASADDQATDITAEFGS